jgi:hypothetical protein
MNRSAWLAVVPASVSFSEKTEVSLCLNSLEPGVIDLFSRGSAVFGPS